MMGSGSQLRCLVFLLCGLTVLMLVINMNAVFTVKQAVEPKRIVSLLYETMYRDVNIKLKQPSSAETSYQSSVSSEDHPFVISRNNEKADFLPRLAPRDNPNEAPFFFYKNLKPRAILGRGRPQPVSIVIGIPSVKRPNVTYLEGTLTSLFDNMLPAEEDSVTVVVYLAENDEKFVTSQMKKLGEVFPYELDCGLLQVITPPEDLYPAFDVLPQTLGDPANRVAWRSKEVVDAAYLMFVCRDKAKHYLMLEDDVEALRGYVSYIEEYAAERSGKEYAFLSFSRFNSIGKLFPTSKAPKWASFLMTFYGQKPVDWLMADYVYLMSCYGGMDGNQCQQNINNMVPKFRVNLFNHLGHQSSLPGKTYDVTGEEHFSKQNQRNGTHGNPKAEVTSDFRWMHNTSAEALYLNGGNSDLSFCVANPKANEKLTVSFDAPQKIAKIVLKTGKSRRGSSSYCDSCAVVEVQLQGSASHTLCSYTAWRGNAVCTPAHPVNKFRIRNTRDVNRTICFSALYVQM